MRVRLASGLIVLLIAFIWLTTPAPVRADGFVVLPCSMVGGMPIPSDMVTPNSLPPAFAQATPTTPIPSFLPPRPPSPVRPGDCAAYLAVKNHNVTVDINDQVARTHVDETFVNDSNSQLEGTYIFPLPDDASVSDFAMWVDGQKLHGQILDRNEARRIYEDIVRTRRDPALLEYIGRNAFQARIFPIPPHSEKRVEIDYFQVLSQDNGLVRYIYPLNTEKFSPKPLQRVSINASVESKSALKAIYSPSHDVSIVRNGNYSAKVGYEDSNVRPDRDFVLYYSTSQSDVGLNLISYKPTGEDGFFVLLVAPPVQVTQKQVIAKDVILVLDVSGSMQGPKIDQAKRALKYILDQLYRDDRFNVVAFSTGTNTFAATLQELPAREEAKKYVDNLRAEGSTDINRALLEAIRMTDNERPTTIIFLTDGLPTTGETNTQRIISTVSGAAPKNVRLFTFGMGDDVNTILLDTLAEKMRGASRYVRPNEKINEVVSAFYSLVSTPVLADISVDWGSTLVSDVYPYPLPDLFAGSQLVITGRYRSAGNSTITLRGKVNGLEQVFKYSDLSLSEGVAKNLVGSDLTPRLWATRKIGYLLNQVRLNGEVRETINEIVALAVRYGIVTPYTSFLVDERKDVLTEVGRTGAAQDLSKSFGVPGAVPTSGATAVQQSQQQNQLRSANVAPAAPTMAARAATGGQNATEPTPRIQLIGDKTFILRDGVWSDTQYDRTKTQTKKIEFGSDAYFEFVSQHPDSARYLALGAHLILIADGAAFEFTTDGTGAQASAGVSQPGVSIPAVGVTSLLHPTGSTDPAAEHDADTRPNALGTIQTTMGLIGVVVVGATLLIRSSVPRR